MYLITNFQDSETNCAQLEQEINDLLNEITELEDMLLAKQKEVLSWDGLVSFVTFAFVPFRAYMYYFVFRSVTQLKIFRIIKMKLSKEMI